MKPVLKVACFGAGYFSQFHYAAWRRIEQVTLVGAADRDLAKARQMGPPAYTDLAGLLQSTSPDILDIITPPATHHDAIVQACSAKVGTIICQKPFCRDIDEARDAVACAAGAGVRLLVHENFRFQPWYRAIHAELEAGTLGDVHQMTFRLRTGDGQGAQAYLDRQPYFQTMPRLLIHETAVHFIDTFQYLLGPISAVYADLRRMNPVITGEDAGYVLFDFQNNVRALFDGNRLLDHGARNCRTTLGEALIEGTAGTLQLTGDGEVYRRAFGGTRLTEVLAAEEWQGFGGDCVHALQTHVVSALLEDKPFENTAEEYLNVLAIENLVYQSAKQQRKLTV